MLPHIEHFTTILSTWYKYQAKIHRFDIFEHTRYILDKDPNHFKDKAELTGIPNKTTAGG